MSGAVSINMEIFREIIVRPENKENCRTTIQLRPGDKERLFSPYMP